MSTTSMSWNVDFTSAGLISMMSVFGSSSSSNGCVRPSGNLSTLTTARIRPVLSALTNICSMLVLRARLEGFFEDTASSSVTWIEHDVGRGAGKRLHEHAHGVASGGQSLKHGEHADRLRDA